MDNFKSILGILAIFLGLPIAILLVKEALQRWRSKRPMFWVALPFLLGFGILMPVCIEHWTGQRVILIVALELAVALFLLGLFGYAWAYRGLSLLIFLAYAAYLVHEFAWSGKEFSLGGRRSEASPRNALIGFVVIGLPALWFAFTGRFWRSEPEVSEAELEGMKERLLHPDWAFYERHLQRPAPEALRELYADHALITTGGLTFNKKHGISCFNPLDEQSLVDTAEDLGFDIVPVANSDCGDPIYLKPGPVEADAVHLAYHDDPGEVEVLAGSVAELLAKLRAANPSVTVLKKPG